MRRSSLISMKYKNKISAVIAAIAVFSIAASAFAAPFDLKITHRDITDTSDVPQNLSVPGTTAGNNFIPMFFGDNDTPKYQMMLVGSGIGISGGSLSATVNTIETTDGFLIDTLNLKASLANIDTLQYEITGEDSIFRPLLAINAATTTQGDWSETNASSRQYIRNKPSIPTISGATGTYGAVTVANGLVSSGKRMETYSGTSNGSGVYTVTFGTAYSAAPNIQANLINGTDTQSTRITAISTTGFTVLVRNRTDVIGLLPSYANVSGASIDVLITEK